MNKTFLVYKKIKDCDIRSKFIIIPEFSVFASIPFVGSISLFRYGLKIPALLHLGISVIIFNIGSISLLDVLTLALVTHFGLLWYIRKIGYNVHSIVVDNKASNVLQKFLEQDNDYTVRF